MPSLCRMDSTQAKKWFLDGLTCWRLGLRSAGGPPASGDFLLGGQSTDVTNKARGRRIAGWLRRWFSDRRDQRTALLYMRSGTGRFGCNARDGAGDGTNSSREGKTFRAFGWARMGKHMPT